MSNPIQIWTYLQVKRFWNASVLASGGWRGGVLWVRSRVLARGESGALCWDSVPCRVILSVLLCMAEVDSEIISICERKGGQRERQIECWRRDPDCFHLFLIFLYPLLHSISLPLSFSLFPFLFPSPFLVLRPLVPSINPTPVFKPHTILYKGRLRNSTNDPRSLSKSLSYAPTNTHTVVYFRSENVAKMKKKTQRGVGSGRGDCYQRGTSSETYAKTLKERAWIQSETRANPEWDARESGLICRPTRTRVVISTWIRIRTWLDHPVFPCKSCNVRERRYMSDSVNLWIT